MKKKPTKNTVYEGYPLLAKYNIPIVKTPGGFRFDNSAEWPIAGCPWSRSDFNSVLGQVTMDEHGTYLCDIEDTLYALERGWRYRGGY